MLNQNFKITRNSHGVMHKLNSISKAFMDYAKKCDGLVLDIGAAYGIATITTLVSTSNTQVIACDIDQDHLKDLSVCAKETEKLMNKEITSRLSILNKKFPHFDLDENSLDAALASHVMHFLSGEEIEQGIMKLSKYLKPFAKFYMTSYSIYNNVMKNYIPVYEKRKADGESWPGEIEDASLYWDKKNPLSDLLPKQLNHLEPSLLKPLLMKYNFKIDYLEFIPTTDEIPNEIKLDGREAVGLIATKLI